MLPDPNTSYVEQARKLLIHQYRGKPVIQGFLDSYIRPLQELEDVLWDIIEARLLESAVDAQLDTLGRLVKETRRGRTNEEYRVGIRIKIKVLRSKGRISDVIEVASLANAPEVPMVEEHRYLNFHVEAYSQVGERFLADFLSQTRAASSYGCLVTSDLAQDDLALFDDANDPDPTVETFIHNGATTGKLIASCYGLPQFMKGSALFTTTEDELSTGDDETMLDEDGNLLAAENQ